jgi:hypothetical protein
MTGLTPRRQGKSWGSAVSDTIGSAGFVMYRIQRLKLTDIRAQTVRFVLISKHFARVRERKHGCRFLAIYIASEPLTPEIGE